MGHEIPKSFELLGRRDLALQSLPANPIQESNTNLVSNYIEPEERNNCLVSVIVRKCTCKYNGGGNVAAVLLVTLCVVDSDGQRIWPISCEDY